MVNVLMVGVDKGRVGGMWTVAENYLTCNKFVENTNLQYVSTSTNGSKLYRLRKMLNGFKKINDILRRNKISILHIHMAERGSAFRACVSAWIGRRYETKVILHMHAGLFLAWYKTLNGIKKRLIDNVFEKSDAVIVLGDYWKKTLSSIVDENKIKVVYNGVDIINENPYNLSARNISFFSILNRNKGIYDFLKAIELIKDKIPKDVKIKLYGNDLEGDVQNKITEYDLTMIVEFVGWVKGSQKEDALASTMISVLPSYYEGLSMTALEAEQHGIPFVTTDISTMREIVGDSIPLIKPGDHIGLADLLIELIQNESLRVRWSTVEFERQHEMFSINKQIKDTLMIYEDLVLHESR